MNCIGGASGDMLLGAIVDAGLSLDLIRRELGEIGIQGGLITAESVTRSNIKATKVSVRKSSKPKKQYTIEDFISIIDDSNYSSRVKRKSCEILTNIEIAERNVHGKGHQLHELGDIDTLIDVVGVVLGFEFLGLEKIYSSPLPTGSGFVMTEEGMLPVPVPAVLALISMKNAPVVTPSGPYIGIGELVTPTGAALVTTLASFKPTNFAIQQVSYGAGSKDFESVPNVVGLWMGNEENQEVISQVVLIETNLDDMTPEMLGYLQETLLTAGALDVWFTPIQMKKNRPAVALSVICKSDISDFMAKLVLKNSSTLGVRFQLLNRYEAKREIIGVDTFIGEARVKLKYVDGQISGVSPEFEDCRVIAENNDVPLHEVYRIIEAEARKKLGMD